MSFYDVAMKLHDKMKDWSVMPENTEGGWKGSCNEKQNVKTVNTSNQKQNQRMLEILSRWGSICEKSVSVPMQVLNTRHWPSLSLHRCCFTRWVHPAVCFSFQTPASVLSCVSNVPCQWAFPRNKGRLEHKYGLSFRKTGRWYIEQWKCRRWGGD